MTYLHVVPPHPIQCPKFGPRGAYLYGPCLPCGWSCEASLCWLVVLPGAASLGEGVGVLWAVPRQGTWENSLNPEGTTCRDVGGIPQAWSGVPCGSLSPSPGSLHTDSLQGWVTQRPPPLINLGQYQMECVCRGDRAGPSWPRGARVQLRREEGRLANLSPGMAWKDQGDAHPNLSQSQARDLLAGGRLLKISQHEPRNPTPWSAYVPTPASRVSVQPSPPAPRTDRRVP